MINEENIESLVCDRSTKSGLSEYAQRLAEALGENLLGVYVHGSLARGCFHESVSDVDVIAVLDGACDRVALSAVGSIHRGIAVPIDATFVTQAQLQSDAFPAPVEFVIKPDSDGTIAHLPEGSRDFPLDREDMYEAGVAVFGPPPRALAGRVPWGVLAGCLNHLLPEIIPRFRNPVLMLCRAAYAYARRQLCSKRDAGQWALEQFGERWRPMIEQALAEYAQGQSETVAPAQHLLPFQEYCVNTGRKLYRLAKQGPTPQTTERTDVQELEMPKTVAMPASIEKISQGPRFHWFGYYDKLQFDPTGRYVLGMEVDFEHRSPTADDRIAVGMIDLADENRWIELGTSSAWCWQQGCMLQWRPGSDSEVLWNDRQDGQFVCHILDVQTGRKRTIPSAVYSVSPDGKTAVTADFRRINDKRPGYGYAGLADPNAGKLAPDDSGIWSVDLETGKTKLIITLAQVAAIDCRYADLAKGRQWFNHLLFNPDGSRFVFLHRWRMDDGVWDNFSTRMFSANFDGSDIRLVTDGEGKAISHFIWLDPTHLNIWLGAPGAFAVVPDDGSGSCQPMLESLDGHQSYLGDNEWMIYDAYPGEDQHMPLFLLHLPSGRHFEIGRFYAPSEYNGEWRCDLHPRVSPDGRRLCIDSVHEGDGRQMYLLDVSGILSSVSDHES